MVYSSDHAWADVEDGGTTRRVLGAAPVGTQDGHPAG